MIFPQQQLLSNFFKNLSRTKPVTAGDVADRILVDLQRISDTPVIAKIVSDTFIPEDGQSVFALPNTPNANLMFPIVQVNGKNQIPQKDYTVVGNIVRWISTDFSLQSTFTLGVFYSY